MSLATVFLALTTVALVIGLSKAPPVRTVIESRAIGLSYFAVLTALNAVLIWKLRSAKQWAHNLTLGLYTLSVLLDCYRFLVGVADPSTMLTIVFAGAVIVLLTASESSREYFEAQ